MTSIARLHTATQLMKFYYPSRAILHEKESSMQIILQFEADLAIQSSSCVVELWSELPVWFFSLVIPYALGGKKSKTNLKMCTICKMPWSIQSARSLKQSVKV